MSQALIFMYLSTDNLQRAALKKLLVSKNLYLMYTVFCIFLLLLKISVIKYASRSLNSHHFNFPRGMGNFA